MITPDSLAARLDALVAFMPGLTLEGVDALAGLARGHVSQLTRGRTDTPRSKTVRKVAGVFGVSSGYLLFGEGVCPSEQEVRKAVEAARAEWARDQVHVGPPVRAEIRPRKRSARSAGKP